MNLQQVKIFLPPDYMCFHRSSDKLKKKMKLAEGILALTSSFMS